jgi:VWFA-related protein
MSIASGSLGLFLGAALIHQEPAKAPPVFGVSIENVYIDAFVSQRGAPLPGLAASDFELRDNGVVQQLELASSDAQPLLAVLTFDTSGSLLEGEKLLALKAASQALLETLRPEDEATLFTFNDVIQWLAPPTTDKAAVRRALDRLQPGGGTPVRDALYAAITLPESRGRTLVVLFTDGVDNLSWLDWRQVLLVAERSNALIHVVSLQPPVATVAASQGPLRFGNHIVPAEGTRALEYESSFSLRQIAEATGGRYWEAESLDRLKTAFAAIAEAMAKRYVLRYVPENVKRPGWHKIELKLKGKTGDVRTRTGYWIPDR